ncbi:MAG: PSD1 and planctomycete cytochrome C domain-containing protein [Planctomycetaceae bacterium]
MISTLIAGPIRAETPDAGGVEFFEKKIRPVLVKHCYECHSAGAKKVQGGLLLDTRDAIRAGGESGPAVVPEVPKDSLLLEAIRYESFEMPPTGRLPAEIVADFERWIAMGAPDPRDGEAQKSSDKSPWQSTEPPWWSDPPRRPALPAVSDASWPRSELDRFILARLEQEGLQPVGDAVPAALLRRVHFDLIGLPPSPEEVDAFLRDPSPKAYAEVVDRLLASPHFGERWGRHWLDVARYADSNGKDRDVLFWHAWRYRDYVIAAFNDDMPFDRFITEQIAGDLLPAATSAERDKLVVATGFLAIGAKTLTETGEQLKMNIVDEQIDTATRSILALTVACARCHDHKFDPIPTADYYALAGIFRSTKTFYGKGITNSKTRKVNVVDGGYYRFLGPDVEAQVRQFREEVDRIEQQIAGTSPKSKEDRAKLTELRKRLLVLQGETPPDLQLAMAVGEAERPEDCHVLIGGEIERRGPKVPRGVLSAVRVARPIEIDPAHSGRLELARRLTDPSNPLTPRVAVNRIWMHLFGRGLVASVDNFGATGEKPSHPELLDFLALRFVEGGWSSKRLIREIVLSRAYRLSGDFHERNHAVDPENTLVWRMSQRRMDAEALRDAMLAASGRLVRTPPDVTDRTDPTSLYRAVNAGDHQLKMAHNPFPFRSVYLPILRQAVPEMLDLFDFADPSVVVGQRSVTNVPAQSLYLMNSPFVIEQADGVALRVLEQKQIEDADRVQLAHKACLSRPASDREVAAALAFLQRMDRHLSASISDPGDRRRAVWSSYCQALFGSAEFRYLD